MLAKKNVNLELIKTGLAGVYEGKPHQEALIYRLILPLKLKQKAKCVGCGL